MPDDGDQPKPWSAVESNPQYQALPADQKEKARAQYFDQVVALPAAVSLPLGVAP